MSCWPTAPPSTALTVPREHCEVLDGGPNTAAAVSPALVTMLLDVGVATVVVDYAVRVDVADSGPLLGAGHVAHAGDRGPGCSKRARRATST
jgi:hypothetical protein